VVNVKVVFAVFISLLFLLPLVFADRTEDIFQVSTDTNNRIIAQEKAILDAKTAAVNAQNAAQDGLNKAGAANESVSGLMLITVILTAVLTSIFVRHYATKPFVDEVYLLEQKITALEKAIKELPKTSPLEAKPGKILKKICPKCGSEGVEAAVFCPFDGKKYVMKEVLFEAAVEPNLAIQQTAQAVENRARKKFFGLF
jgi:hypothetical protein